MTDPKINPILSEICKMASSHRDKVCLQDKLQSLTYAQLIDKVGSFAGQLKSKGVLPGDRLLIPIENSVDSMVALLGILMTNSTAILVNPNLPPNDFHQLVSASDPVAILSSPNAAKSLALESIPDIPVWNIENFPSDRPIIKRLADKDANIAVILFTSGTSGAFKGVMLSYENVLAGVETAHSQFSADSNFYWVLPLYHVLVVYALACLMHGGSLKFITLETIFEIFQSKQPFIFGVVPRILEVLLAKFQSDPQLKALLPKMGKGFIQFICAGAPLSNRVEQAYLDLGLPVYCGYGLTESTGICFITPKNKQIHIGSVGFSVPLMDAKIHQPDNNGIGEVCLKGHQVMKGYFRNSKETAVAMKGGWLHSGDLGRFDSDGYLFITGRLKDVVVLPTGEKAMPDNIESHYAGIKGVKELAVVGIQVKGQVWDEIHAAVILENKEIKIAEIEALIFERGKNLPFHLQIQKVHLVPHLPKTALQKVQRSLLKEMLKKDEEKGDARLPFTDDPLYLWLRLWLAKTIGIDPAEIDENRFFTVYGIDSLTLWQLCESLYEKYQFNVTPLIIMEHQSIAKLAEYCKANQNKGEISRTPPMLLADRSKELPLSIAEQTHWERARYPWQNFLFGTDLVGAIDVKALEQSIADLLSRHEILRTTYQQKENRLIRQIHLECKGAFQFFDFSSYPEQKKGTELDQLAKSLREKPIDVGTLPLIHFALVKLSSTHHALIVWISRICVDGGSLILILDELATFYNERIQSKTVSSLEPQKYQYADYANWQRNLYDQGYFQKHEEYWKGQFKKMELVPLPGKKGHLTKEEQLLKNNLIQETIPIFIPQPLCKELTLIALHRNSFLQTLLATALQVALHHTTKSSNITIRDLNADRKKSYLKRMLGYLNTGLGIIGDFSAERKFEEHLADHQKQLYNAMIHGDIFFEALVGKWGSLIKGSPPYSLNVSFNFLSFHPPGKIGDRHLSFKDLHLQEYLYPPGLELDLVLSYTPDGSVAGGMSYKKALFEEADISQIRHVFLQVLQKVAENPSIFISEIFKPTGEA